MFDSIPNGFFPLIMQINEKQAKGFFVCVSTTAQCLLFSFCIFSNLCVYN